MIRVTRGCTLSKGDDNGTARLLLNFASPEVATAKRTYRLFEINYLSPITRRAEGRSRGGGRRGGTSDGSREAEPHYKRDLNRGTIDKIYFTLVAAPDLICF